MKASRSLALLLLFALVLAACGGTDGGDSSTTTGPDETTTTGATETTDPPERGEAGQGGELTLLQWQAPSSANPYLSTGEKDLLASSPVLESLAEVAPDGSLVPNLATEIPTKSAGTIAEDDSSITWTIQEGVLWSDGTPLTSDDLVFTWEYCSNEATGCSQDMSTIDTVEATDDHTIVIHFVSPQPYPFGTFTTFNQPVLQRAQFEDCVGAEAISCTEQNFAPIGTGPFVITELRPEDTVSYEMNPNYRGIPEGKPFFGSITLKGGGDAEASARSVLEVDEADYAWNLQVAPELLGPMEEAGNGVVKVGFTADVEHINLNQTDPNGAAPSEYEGDVFAPTGGTHPVFYQNGEFARALSLAISRDQLVQVGYGPAGSPVCTLWPVPGEATTNQDWCLTQDIDAANAILDELGYLDTDDDGVREHPAFGPLVFEYVTSTNAVRQSNQDIVKANWAEIGVVAEMANQDASLFFDGTCASDFCIWKFFTDIQMFTNGSSLPDAQNYLVSWKSSEIPTSADAWGGDNMPRLNSQEFDDVWDQLASTALDDPARAEQVIRLQDIMVEQGAVIPLIHRGDVSAFGSDIQGIGELNAWDSEYWNVEDWTRSE